MPDLQVFNLAADQKALLEKWGVRDFPVTRADLGDALRVWPPDQIRDTFYHASGGRLDLQALLYNLIWQGYTLIKEGRRESIQGNLRSFWYKDTKSPLAHLGLLKSEPETVMGMLGSAPVTEEPSFELIAEFSGDPHPSTSAYLCGEMTKAFDEFVRQGIFRFRDWGFIDDSSHRFVEDGRTKRLASMSRPNVIFVAEKGGFMKTAKEIADTFGCHAICLGGEPKYITSEFFVEEVSKVIDPASTDFLLLMCVDYDAAGDDIAQQFQKQLGFFGLKRSRIVNVFTLDLLTPEEVAWYKYPLPMNTKTRITLANNWVAKIGGINGEPYGIESDVVPRERILERLEAVLKAGM